MENCSDKARKNSCPWPPPTAKHPGNKFRLLERKKKSISWIPVWGYEDHTQEETISPKTQSWDQRGVFKCHSTLTNLEQVPEYPSQNYIGVGVEGWEGGKAPNSCGWNRPQQGMLSRKTGDRQDLNYQILFKTPKRGIYYLKNKLIQLCVFKMLISFIIRTLEFVIFTRIFSPSRLCFFYWVKSLIFVVVVFF